VNILTLDIEDWCQSAPDVYEPERAWDRTVIPPTRRVVENSHRLIDILGRQGARATCFVLGSVAERFPVLVKDFYAEGHEIATHGYGHRAVYTLTPEEFVADVRRARTIIEDIIGERVLGYRAPYFSITQQSTWALPLLAELGFTYDGSTFPLHRRYYQFPNWAGCPDGGRFPHVLTYPQGRLIEVPCTTVRVLGQNLPLAGGALLRFCSVGIFCWAIRYANKRGWPAVFYLHPHDLDAEELRRPVAGESLHTRFLRWFFRLGREGNSRKLEEITSRAQFVSIREWLATQTDWLQESSLLEAAVVDE